MERRQPCFGALLVLPRISAAYADRANRFTVEHDRQAASDRGDIAKGDNEQMVRCYASSKSLLGRLKRTAVRALPCATSIEPICVPSMRSR